MKRSFLYAISGLGLGLGSPLGAFLLLWVSRGSPSDISAFLHDQWAKSGFFYGYMLIGTCVAFALFGFYLGRYADYIREKNRQLAAQVMVDPLTGLGNHRFLHKTFQKHYVTRKEDSEPISCLMMDLDFFKKVNDNYGHPFGDEVLAIFADILERMIRPGDVATRYGGEEFMCILPRCGKEEARQVSERVRQEMEKEIFYFKRSQIRITVSVGVATQMGKGKNYQDLIRKADMALYRAKKEGRNKVVVV